MAYYEYVAHRRKATLVGVWPGLGREEEIPRRRFVSSPRSTIGRLGQAGQAEGKDEAVEQISGETNLARTKQRPGLNTPGVHRQTLSFVYTV